MKRFFDVAFVIATAPCTLSIGLLVALLVRCKLGKPVLFKQARPGLHGQVFKMVKFRTMLDARGPAGDVLPDGDRLTPFGRWLRSTSLDELPELINVLRGEMSLVGPRPLLVQYLTRYSGEQGRRHDVLPGITGWAQVNGRNDVDWEDRFKLDVWYVDQQSFWLDLKILGLTAWRVCQRKGVSKSGTATMPEFLGNDRHQ